MHTFGQRDSRLWRISYPIHMENLACPRTAACLFDDVVMTVWTKSHPETLVLRHCFHPNQLEVTDNFPDASIETHTCEQGRELEDGDTAHNSENC